MESKNYSSNENISPENIKDETNPSGPNGQTGKNTAALPRCLALLPGESLDVFPQLIYPLTVEDPKAKIAVHKGLENNQIMGFFALKHKLDSYDNLTKDDFFPIGVAILVHKTWEAESGRLKVVAQGLSRIKMEDLCGDDNLSVLVEAVPEPQADLAPLRPLISEVKRLFNQLLDTFPNLAFNPSEFGATLDDKPALMADLMIASMSLKPHEKAEYMAISQVESRLLTLLEYLTIEMSNLEAGRAVSNRMKNSLEKHQREMHLREQLRAIEEELGEHSPDGGGELSELAARLKEKALPDEARQTAEKELKRLQKTPSHASEYGLIRNYLDWILDLPWLESSPEKSDLTEAKAILAQEHCGLEKVKKRIIEFLAVRKLTDGIKSPILCLVGPPGVGKTSLGRSIAKALGREFVHLSLGGVRDEAEIRGHRRTYVGALPGRLISGFKKAKTNNPVFLLDELDKMAQSAMGDPAAALLEVLDPEQNNNFVDHYLEVPFDLSKALFILTANVLENIPGPLRDRLEVVDISGYILGEKLEIAKNNLVPRELSRHGLSPDDLCFNREILAELIESYTKEAGCRDLTRRISAVIRHTAVKKAEGDFVPAPLTCENLTTILGPPLYQKELKGQKAQVGVATGLAWTAAGGDILFIEAVAMPGRGQLLLTGQLGDVMQESAKAAISYVRSKTLEWNLDPDWFKNHDIHVHVPQGAIPKDGPSAGVTLGTAIVSLATGQKVRPEVAMTGEISLRGLVLPVGGVREKLLAAKRAGLTKVLIPHKNQIDLADLPKEMFEGLEIVAVTTMKEVLSHT
ncbi:MAG: endopeptidase La, partial [Candidatus Adiutrix sp.]